MGVRVGGADHLGSREHGSVRERHRVARTVRWARGHLQIEARRQEWRGGGGRCALLDARQVRAEEGAQWRWRAARRLAHAHAVQPQPQRACGRLPPVEHQLEAGRDAAVVGRAGCVGGRRAAAAAARAAADASHAEERLARRCRARGTEGRCRRRGAKQVEARMAGGEVEVQRGAPRGRMLLDEAAQLRPGLARLSQHRRRLPRRTRLALRLGHVGGLLPGVAHTVLELQPAKLRPNSMPSPALSPTPTPGPHLPRQHLPRQLAQVADGEGGVVRQPREQCRRTRVKLARAPCFERG